MQLAILNPQKAKKHAQKGFTLIELLISVVILGVLSSVAVPGFIAQKNKADAQAANAQGRALMAACKTILSDPTATMPDTIFDTTATTAAANYKNFGNVEWRPTYQAGTTCSSVTAGAKTQQQNFSLSMTTGDLNDDQPAK